MAFRTEWFTLDLGGDWVAQETGDPERFSYFSAGRQAQVVVSLMGFDSHGQQLIEVANHLLAVRQRAEEEIAAADGVLVTFDDAWLRPSPDGDTVQINFVGHDSQGGWFFNSGFVHASGLLNVRGELLNSSRKAVDDLFAQVLAGLKF